MHKHGKEAHSRFQSTPPARGATVEEHRCPCCLCHFNPRPPRGGRQQRCTVLPADLWRISRNFAFLGKNTGWLPEKPGERPAFSREKPCEPPGNLWPLGLRGGGKARPGYPCAVPLPRRAACVRGSGDPPADKCSSHRNAPLFSHIASPDSKSADCLSQDP